MRNVGVFILRLVVAVPVGFVVSFLFSYVFVGISWVIDHTILSLPLGGFESLLSLPFRFTLGAGAALSTGYWGLVAAGIIGPRPKRLPILITAVPITAFFGVYVYDALSGGGRIDVFELLTLFGLPLGGVFGIPLAYVMARQMDEQTT